VTAAATSGTLFDDHERRQWRDRAAAYERSFAKLCGHTAPMLLDSVAVGEADRLLDVGTGTGTVAALACARGAKVTAVDAEPSMLDRALVAAPAAEVLQALLPHLPFADGEFDAVTANFVVNHVGDPRAAATEMRRVTRPGGQVAATIWPSPAPPLQRLWSEAISSAGVTPPVLPTVPAELNFVRTEEGLAGLLAAAGYSQVRCTTTIWEHVADLDDWWCGAAGGIGTVGQIVAAQTPEVVARIRAHYERVAETFRRPDGLLSLPTAAVLATGTA
jgi:SAM-dependent methyltransferase